MNTVLTRRAIHSTAYKCVIDPRALLATLLLTAVVVSPLAAQSTSSLAAAPKTNDNEDEITEMSPYVVSSKDDEGYASRQTLVGGRTASNLLEIATGVQIINAEMLNDLSAETMMDALRYGTSGISYNQKQAEDLNIRGFRTTQTLRDGRTKFNFRAQPMYDVERLEVIKGPTAMLLGTSSDANLGGVVNAVSRQPTADRRGQIDATFGEHNDFRVSVNLSGPVAKFKGGELQYRVTVGGQQADTARELENIDQQFVGAALKWIIGRNQSLTVVSHWFVDDSYSYFDDFLDISQPVPGPARLNQYSSESFSYGRRGHGTMEDEERYLSITYLADFGENISVSANFTAVDNIARNLLLSGVNVLADNYTVGRQALPQSLEAKVQNLQLDYQHRIRLMKGTLLTLNAGVDISRRKQRNALSIVPMSALDTRKPDYNADTAFFSNLANFPGFNGQPFSLTDSTQYPLFAGFFAQPQLNFWNNRIILVAGKRWLHDSGTSMNNRTNTNSRRTTRTVPTQKYGGVIKIFPWLSAYYTFAQNFLPRSGVLRTPYLNDPGELLRDQSGELHEFGLKFDKKITERLTVFGSVAHFDQYLTNVITQGIDPVTGTPTRGDGVAYRIQSERDRAIGIETDLGLRLKTSGGYADMIGTLYNADPLTATKTRVNGAPKIVLSFMAKYTWTNGPLNGFTLGVGIYDESSKPLAGNRYIETPITYNAFTSYSWGEHWSVQLNLDNITDERYVVSAGSPASVVGSEPFSGRLGLRYKW